MTIVKERNFTNNSEFVFISNDEVYDDIVSLSIDEFINNGCVGGVAYGIAIKEGIQRNVIEMIDNKRMIIDILHYQRYCAECEYDFQPLYCLLQ